MNLLVADLQLSIPAVGTPQQLQHFSRSHHTQCPTYCKSISPLCPHLQYFLQPVAADQLYMELLNKHKRYKYNIVNIHKKSKPKKKNKYVTTSKFLTLHKNFKYYMVHYTYICQSLFFAVAKHKLHITPLYTNTICCSMMLCSDTFTSYYSIIRMITVAGDFQNWRSSAG